MVDYNLQVPGIQPVQNSMAQMNPLQMMLLGQQLQTNQLAAQETMRKRQEEELLRGLRVDPRSPEYIQQAARISPQFGLQALTSQRQAAQFDMTAERERRQAEEARVRARKTEVETVQSQVESLKKEAGTSVRDQNSYDKLVGRIRRLAPDFQAPSQYDPDFVRQLAGIKLDFHTDKDGRPFAFNPMTREMYDISGGILRSQSAPTASAAPAAVATDAEPRTPAGVSLPPPGPPSSAVGSGQPVNVPPGAPAGTPRIVANNAAPGSAAPAATAAAPFDMGRAKAAISGIESGGNYGALGPVTKTGDRAYGKYQVMGANIPSWTREALGRSMTPAEFLRDPETQEKVFEHHFGKSVQRYGNAADAASVWFSGRPIARAGNATDILGTTVPGYVNKFMAAYGGGGQPAGGRVPRMMTAPAFATAGGQIPPAFTGAAAAPVLNAMSPELINALATPPQQPLAPAGVPASSPTPAEGQPAQQAPAPFGKGKEQESKARVDSALRKMAQAYQALEEEGSVASTKRGALANVGAYLRGTAPGQVVERALATTAQERRDELQSLARQLITDIKNATGMSAQELNSNVELQQMLLAVSNPTQSTQAVRRILNNLSDRFGIGAKLDIKERTEPAPKESGVPRGRRGAEAPATTEAQPQRAIVKTGTYNGKKVVQYSDGSVEYAD